MKDPYSIILNPLRTEKGSIIQEEENKYIFEVNREANKITIKTAVEEIYKVKVKKVNTVNVAGKKRRVRRVEGIRPDWKKAIVTLESGETIDVK